MTGPSDPDAQLRSEDLNDLRVNNCVLVVVTQSASETMQVGSSSYAAVAEHIVNLAAAAVQLGVPIVATGVEVGASLDRDPLLERLARQTPSVISVARQTTNGWPAIRATIEALDRRKLLLTGIWTEVAVTQTALGALREGFRVYVVSDATGGTTLEAHQDAKTRLLQAGGTPINWLAVVCEWIPAYDARERRVLLPTLLGHRTAAGGQPMSSAG